MHLFACNAYTIYHCKSFACCCCCCYCVAVAVREINKRPWNIQLKPVKCNNCKAADATATRMWRNRSRSANEAMSTVVNAVCECVCVRGVCVRVCRVSYASNRWGICANSSHFIYTLFSLLLLCWGRSMDVQHAAAHCHIATHYGLNEDRRKKNEE